MPGIFFLIPISLTIKFSNWSPKFESRSNFLKYLIDYFRHLFLQNLQNIQNFPKTPKNFKFSNGHLLKTFSNPILNFQDVTNYASSLPTSPPIALMQTLRFRLTPTCRRHQPSVGPSPSKAIELAKS